MTAIENPRLPQLPNDIIHQILRRLPTKLAVRMRCTSKKFKDLWSIDLDDGHPPDTDHDNPPHQHTEFINFVETCLDSRKNDQHVDKFRLRMMRYSSNDNAFISRYLAFAFQRNVMVLDVMISVRSKPGLTYYNLPSAFLEQNYLTSLSLEYVRMNLGNRRIKLPLLRTLSFKNVVLEKQNALSQLVSACPIIENLSVNFKDTDDKKYRFSLESLLGLKCMTTLHVENMHLVSDHDNISVHNLPVGNLPLKTMSLKTVHLNSSIFSCLISRCPSIEYMSLSSCSSPCGSSIQFTTSSLKTFEVTDFNAQQLNVYEATNLESFTLVSELPVLGSEISELPLLGSEIGQLTRASLYECKNLKHVNIRSEHLQEIILGGCKDCVEARIDTPNLMYFNFVGNLKSTISMEAPNLWDTNITLLCGDSTPPWRHFPTVVDFLRTFGHSKRILLNFDDAEVDFFFPESFRRSVSCPPLPSLKNLVVWRKEKLKGRDSDLQNSMLWMAPCAELRIKNK